MSAPLLRAHGKHRHHDVREQQQALTQKLRGHFGYFGIIGSYEALDRFLYDVRRVWSDEMLRDQRCLL